MLILELLQHQLVSICHLLSLALPPLLQTTVEEFEGRWSNWVFGSKVRSPFYILHDHPAIVFLCVIGDSTTDTMIILLSYLQFDFRSVS